MCPMMYAFEDCEVDIVRRELRRTGQAVHVEPQVFDLLAYLIRHRGRVVSKAELLKAVWHDRIVSEATLDSRISAARQAIGDTGRRQSRLRTFARRGFRLVCEVSECSQPEATVSKQQRMDATGTKEAPRILTDGPSI